VRLCSWATEQGTVATDLDVAGHGLHTNRRVKVRIRPAEAGHGILFKRTDLGGAIVPADAALREYQPMCTALRSADGVAIRTCEHLLAALLASEIDNALVEINSEEVPILDGSSRPWLEALARTGRQALAAPKRFLRILRPVSVRDDPAGRWLTIYPADRYEATVENHVANFGDFRWEGEISPASFASEIAPSRSYGPVQWAIPVILYGYLRGNKVLRGARPSCTAPVLGRSVIGGLRFDDEFVRHRVLDMVGDLALLGAPLLGRIDAHHPSHEMNYRLAMAIRAEPESWEWATAA
jgi:UDP-3-O-[3-hydroxymyristoyl] N-acetylglucosamine deacetylase